VGRVHRITALGLALLGAGLAWQGVRLRLEGNFGPGPGFFAFWIGVALAALALAWAARPGAVVAGAEDGDLLPRAARARRVGFVLAALAAFAAGLETVGFDLSMLAFLLALMLGLGRDHWPVKLAIAALGSFGLHGLFERVLRVPLPYASLDALRAQGVAYLFVLAPDKHVIYPEHLPASIHRVRPTYRMDELLAYLRQHTDLSVLDLRPALIARKQVEQVYFRTDTHWNDAGAFAGYQDILRAASRAVEGLAPQDRSSFTPVERDEPGGDLAEMLGVPELLRERSTYLEPRTPRRARLLEPPTLREGYEVARVVTEVRDSRLPRLVMFRDSFATRLIPLLSEHFSRAVYLWQYNFDPAVVEAEHPDVVIEEWVGRKLNVQWPYDAVADLEGHKDQGSGFRTGLAIRP